MTHKHSDHAHGHHPQSHSWQPHKDWRLWVAVVLMLAGMLAYVMSDDESIQSGGNVQPAVPAAP